jgi:hypothetical protein
VDVALDLYVDVALDLLYLYVLVNADVVAVVLLDGAGARVSPRYPV